MVCLTSCATANIERSSQALKTPDLVHYTDKQQSKAADELEACNCSMLEKMLIDYKVMRDQVRALKSSYK